MGGLAKRADKEFGPDTSRDLRIVALFPVINTLGVIALVALYFYDARDARRKKKREAAIKALEELIASGKLDEEGRELMEEVLQALKDQNHER